MPVKKSNDRWECSCGKNYDTRKEAESCLISHTVIYVPMTTTEFNRLHMAITLGDLTLIPNSLWDTFQKVQRSQFRT